MDFQMDEWASKFFEIASKSVQMYKVDISKLTPSIMGSEMKNYMFFFTKPFFIVGGILCDFFVKKRWGLFFFDNFAIFYR